MAAAPALRAEVSATDLEEASEVARRAAGAALHGPAPVLFEALDIDGILARRFGDAVWARLSERQREPLRAVVREAFAAALAPPRSTPGEIVWSSARENAGGASVFLGMRFGDRWLKSRWFLHRAALGGWRVEDVTLSDPGVSVAARALASLGPRPIQARDRRAQARREALPRLLGLAAIGLTVFFVTRRLAPGKRLLLLLTASAPAFLFLVDGILAVRRALAEPYAISRNLSSDPSERWLRLAREAEREGEIDRARPLWERAIRAGAAPGPVAFERGLAARERQDPDSARRSFQAALEAAEPAPGALRELALLALSEGKSSEARTLLDRYLERTGPDPDALSLDAVIETNLGNPQKALEALRQAREMVGGGARATELEARVHARAADAPGTVAALRLLEPAGRLDRDALRSDPAYLPIATDPAWVAFLNEAAPPAPEPTPAPREMPVTSRSPAAARP